MDYPGCEPLQRTVRVGEMPFAGAKEMGEMGLLSSEQKVNNVEFYTSLYDVNSLSALEDVAVEIRRMPLSSASSKHCLDR